MKEITLIIIIDGESKQFKLRSKDYELYSNTEFALSDFLIKQLRKILDNFREGWETEE